MKLAMLGGPRTVPAPDARTAWPVVTDADRDAILRVLASEKFTSNCMGEGEVGGLEHEWARHVGVRNCAAVSNGTAALSLSLAALRIPAGSEVVVPALSFIATALAVVRQLAVPVFVDVDPVTFNLDPDAVAAAITPRTSAIIAVHLHGLPAEMHELRELADRHGSHLVEDAAQAQGASYRGRKTGALGTIAGFSLNVTKNLPTCGEGGLVTTDDGELHERVLKLRQFGEVIKGDEERTYISHLLGSNEKINAIQAAFARTQLARFDEYCAAREQNVRRLLDRLAELPGVVVPTCPTDRTHAWHILRFRFSPEAMGHEGVPAGALRKILHRALRAEGVPVSQYQLVPLPGQETFRTREGVASGYPWKLPMARDLSYRVEDYPVALDVIEDSLTLQKRHLNPQSGAILDDYANGFEKVWENIDFLAGLARTLPYDPPWAKTLAAASA